MRTSTLLKDIELGSDVAESDEHLRSYFVQTHIFQQVVHDETDLILGAKGTGKTAIFRMLSDPKFDVPAMPDVIVIPAFNVQGSVLFSDLSDSSLVDERVLRRLWAAYILALVGAHVVENFPESDEKTSLRRELQTSGLLAQGVGTRGVWKTILAPIKRISEATSVEGRLGVTGVVDVGGRLEMPSRPTVVSEAPPWISGEFDAEAVTEKILDILYRHSSRCWVIFDRLDEAFEDPGEERAALRGLMRAQADLSSYNASLRVKLFLRSDILDRVTREAGFVNVTHFRTLRIAWSKQQVLDLVVTRLSESEEYLRFLHSRGVSDKDGAVRALFSRVVEGNGKSYLSAFAYMVERTLDASAELNPRNIVSFLREARNFELSRCERNDPTVGANPPITQDSMVRAWRRLSEKRLIDTLYAEFNAIRPTVEKFRNGPQRFDRPYMASSLGIPVGSSELDDLIAKLEYSGFMSLRGRHTYRVGDLYRPALGLNPKWEDRAP